MKHWNLRQPLQEDRSPSSTAAVSALVMPRGCLTLTLIQKSEDVHVSMSMQSRRQLALAGLCLLLGRDGRVVVPGCAINYSALHIPAQDQIPRLSEQVHAETSHGEESLFLQCCLRCSPCIRRKPCSGMHA